MLGKTYQEQINNQAVVIVPASEALREVLPEIEKEADFIVVLSHSTPEETRALAAEFPQIDVVVTAGGAGEPPNEAELLNDGRTRLVEVGQKGMYLAVLGLYDDAETPIRYQRVPLDARFANSPAMHKVLVDYQQELETVGLKRLITSSPQHPSGATFVGSENCKQCHESAFEKWEMTGHAHATQTLVKLDPPRHYDPECLSCHATGWDPQKYFPWEGGYLGLDATPLLAANGCENCHGPGSAHVAAEGPSGSDPADRARLQKSMRLPISEAKAKCFECHDHDNSPEFDFDTYWPLVEHY